MMNRHNLLSIAALGAVLSLLVVAPRAEAQRGGRNGNNGNMMGGMMMGGPGGFRMVEPTVSNTSQLIKRPDVQTELVLSGRQREQLVEVQQGMVTDMSKRVRENMPDFRKLRNMSPEDRQVEQEKMRQQAQDGVQSAMSGATSEMDKKLMTILSPGQMKRLRELDLQWRGTLAVGDKTVGEKFAFTSEQTQQVQQLLGEYTKERNDAMSSAFSGMMGGGRGGRRGANGAGAGTTPADGTATPTPPTPPAAGGRPQFDPADMEKRMTEAQASTDKVRLKLNEKALEIFTPEQLALWKTMNGKKFVFRKNEQ